MTEAQATLVAAVIAAVFSIVAALMSHGYARIAAQLLARQNTIGSDLRALSTLTYEVIAISKLAHKTKEDSAFRGRIADAYRASKDLDRIRREHRYTIPFIDQPLYRLTRMPFYVQHCRNDLEETRIAGIFHNATKLREQIDAALRDFYFDGRRPDMWRRFWLWWHRWKMKRGFSRIAEKRPSAT